MKSPLKSLPEQVVVITGASSGIGLATAKSAAAQGARVVLVSRNGEVLAQVEQQIRADGGEAIHVVADVGNREDLQRVADTAIARYGGFDTWVNNAGLGIVGRLEEVSDEDNHRLFQTNFWGLVYGSLIAVKHFKTRGGARRGSLINLGSVVSEVALPMQGMYSTTKHAIKGFTDALRTELLEEKAPVAVTLIQPAAINTPFPNHARNYSGSEPDLPPPVYPPEEVAHAILQAAVHGHHHIFVGGAGKLMAAMAHRFPQLMNLVGVSFIPQTFRDEPPRDPAGALHQAGKDGQVHGDHPGYVMKTSLYTRAVLHPGAALAALAVGVTAVALLVTGNNGHRKSRW